MNGGRPLGRPTYDPQAGTITQGYMWPNPDDKEFTMALDPTTLDMALARSPLTVNVLDRLADLEAKIFGDAERPWVVRHRIALGQASADEVKALQARLAELGAATSAPKK